MSSYRLTAFVVALGFFVPGPLRAEKPTSTADRIVVYKHSRRMLLFSGDKEVKEYKVALGIEPVGPKRREGDHRTPEGTYVLDFRNDHSQYYKSLHISYPSPDDLARARKLGVRPGGMIMLHGTPSEFSDPAGPYDWTDGCIAVTNSEMDEILNLVAVGTKIEIHP